MTNLKDIPIPAAPETVGHDTDNREKVRVGAYSGGRGRGQNISICGLDSAELEVMRGAMHGHHWITCKDGRIQHVPTYEPLPNPVADDMMLPFWRRPLQGEGAQYNLFPFEQVPAWASPSITIGSLCGYNYSAENYRYQARSLMRWGFICLRSQRDASGEYWENWYLPGLWAAKEELKFVIEALDAYALDANTAREFLRETASSKMEVKQKKDRNLNDKERQRETLDTAVRFLCNRVQFGTLDISVQRAAMSVD